VIGLHLQGEELRLTAHWVQFLLSQRGYQRLGRGTHLPVLTNNERDTPVLKRERLWDQLGQVDVLHLSHWLLREQKGHLLLLHLFRDYN
jgi:hypothetical protein